MMNDREREKSGDLGRNGKMGKGKKIPRRIAGMWDSEFLVGEFYAAFGLVRKLYGTVEEHPGFERG